MAVTKRKTKQNEASEDNKSKKIFADHSAKDKAMSEKEDSEEIPSKGGMTNFGRFLLFLAFPLLMGMFGLYAAYISSLYNPKRQVNFDNDFILPFILTLAMVSVIGFQTGGFAGKKSKPIVSWPKVRRKKKVIYKTVIVDDKDVDHKEE